ncbi:fumarylacetoacetate hydrolase family protein [Kiritimatiellaeota bacterium B1221]|nr:fumarylacetoacetate hydrolase family protein [Kiritimatiellaeota bacterium B1221]
MKIAQIQTADGQNIYATPSGNKWFRCEGDLHSGWTQTEQIVKVHRFLPPISPAVIFGIGLNYRAHAEEMGSPLPDFPVVFMKNISAVTGHGEPIFLPRHLNSDAVDYEVELAVVIGKTAKNVPEEKALEYVAGYAVGNDVSARDWQKIFGGGQWSRGKSFDSFCPLGPVMVTADEIPDPNRLPIRMTLNDEVVQDSNTSDQIFTVEQLISFLSGSTTLLPGTIILTGTPPGVGAGKKPPVYLKAGDRLQAEIEGIGSLQNNVIEESP